MLKLDSTRTETEAEVQRAQGSLIKIWSIGENLCQYLHRYVCMKKPLNEVLCEVRFSGPTVHSSLQENSKPRGHYPGVALGGGLLLGSRFLQSVAVKTTPGAPRIPFESGLLSLAV